MEWLPQFILADLPERHHSRKDLSVLPADFGRNRPILRLFKFFDEVVTLAFWMFK
jgi:hypothetical protein